MVAGRDVPFGLGVVSALASWIWALSVNAPAQAAYNFGVAGPVYFGLGGAIMLVVLAPFAGKIRALAPRGRTLPGFIAQRHGAAGRHTILAINMLSVGVLLFLNLTVVGYLVETFTELSYGAGVVIVCAIAAGYAILGGISASIITDVIQIALITIAAVVLVPTMFHRAGGVASIASGIAGDKADLFSRTAFLAMGLPFLVQSLVSAFAYPGLWQLTWAIRGRSVTKAFITAGVSYIPYALLLGSVGLIALGSGVVPGDASASDIAPATAREFLPASMGGLFIVLVLAAACSSCDTSLSAFGALAMNDIYRAHVNPKATDRQMLLAGRVSMALFAAVMAALAVRKVSLLEAVFFIGAAKAAMLFPLIATLYWKRLTSAGFVSGILGGMAIGVALFLGLKHAGVEHYRAISTPCSVAAGAVIAVGVSLAGGRRRAS